MERILKTVPVDLRNNMEALVHDLTLALEESNNKHVRRQWSIRRRTRSAGNNPSFSVNKISDDSSSSVCDIHFQKHVQIPSTTFKYESESDDNCNISRFSQFSTISNISNIESDSFNENFVSRTFTRRKKKFKKITIDSNASPSTSQAITKIVISNEKKKRHFPNGCENRYDIIWCGKRKRSYRERSMDYEMQTTKSMGNTKIKNKAKTSEEDSMDCSHISSSSISSSDSEGIITNEEDREGDDEHSDWIGDSSWWDDSENKNEEKLSNTSYQSFIHRNVNYLNKERQRNYRQKVQWIQNGLSGREFLAGRRHVKNTSGYSIITSANEELSRFLQNSNESELKLHPMQKCESEKLRGLANLYNLNLKGDLTCPILYKTKYTTQAICVDRVSLKRLSDYKRFRRTTPISSNLETKIKNYNCENILINDYSNTEPSLCLKKNIFGD